MGKNIKKQFPFSRQCNMDQSDIALELLVRSGNPEGIEHLAQSVGLAEARRIEKVAEAGVYSAIRYMWQEAEGGIDSPRICQFLNQERFAEYLSRANNAHLLEQIVDVLQAGMQANMEAYAQITAVDVLGIAPLAAAIRRKHRCARHARESD